MTGSQIAFTPDEKIPDLTGNKPVKLHNENIFSYYPFDIQSFDNIFLETDFAQGMIYEAKRSGVTSSFIMDVDPGNKYVEKIRGGVNWYMIGSKGFISNINFKFKNEN